MQTPQNNLNSIIKRVKKKAIVLLPELNNQDIEQIKILLKKHKEIVINEIGEENKRFYLLLQSNEKIIKSQLLAQQKKAMKKRNYGYAMTIQNKIIASSLAPSKKELTTAGFVYLKLRDVKTAYDYFKIVTIINNQKDKNYDFSTLLKKLETYIKNDRKKQIEKNIANEQRKYNNFQNDINNDYELKNFDELLEMIELSIPIDIIFKKRNADAEQQARILLILAKKSYANNDFKQGDNYLLMVEKIENKSDLVKKELIEIRKNKKFYSNRIEENQKTLTKK